MDNIGDFAEQLVLGEVNNVQSGKSLPPSQNIQEGMAPAGKDIQRTQVPDSFMQEILGDKYVSKNPVIEEAEIPELVWTDPDGNSDSWESMEKSYGYKPTKKPNLRGDSTKKAVLKASIKNRLSKRNETD